MHLHSTHRRRAWRGPRTGNALGAVSAVPVDNPLPVQRQCRPRRYSSPSFLGPHEARRGHPPLRDSLHGRPFSRHRLPFGELRQPLRPGEGHPNAVPMASAAGFHLEPSAESAPPRRLSSVNVCVAGGRRLVSASRCVFADGLDPKPGFRCGRHAGPRLSRSAHLHPRLQRRQRIRTNSRSRVPRWAGRNPSLMSPEKAWRARAAGRAGPRTSPAAFRAAASRKLQAAQIPILFFMLCRVAGDLADGARETDGCHHRNQHHPQRIFASSPPASSAAATCASRSVGVTPRSTRRASTSPCRSAVRRSS